MIKANELRIGNKVKDRGGKVLTIDYWERKDMVAKRVVIEGIEVHPLTEYCEYLQPIPLTPEILEKCGLIKDVESAKYNYNDYTSTHLFIRIQSNRFLVRVNNTLIYFNNPFHLHQLQNLYFALTGEELNITL